MYHMGSYITKVEMSATGMRSSEVVIIAFYLISKDGHMQVLPNVYYRQPLPNINRKIHKPNKNDCLILNSNKYKSININ